MANHPVPTYLQVDCSDAFPRLFCQNHWRKDETNIYQVENTIAGTNPFDPGAGSISIGSNYYNLSTNDSGYVTASVATCKKSGWYGFGAGKYWHGRYGFHHAGCTDVTYTTTATTEECNADPTEPISVGSCWKCKGGCSGAGTDCLDGTCFDFGGFEGFSCCKKCHEPFTTKTFTPSCASLPAQSNDTTKYLSMAASGSISAFSGSTFLYKVNLSFTSTVNRYSGVVTATSNYDASRTGELAFMQSYLKGKMSDASNIVCPSAYEPGKPDPECPRYDYLGTYDDDPTSICYPDTPLSQIEFVNNRWNWNYFRDYPNFCGSGASVNGPGSNGTMTHSDTSISVTEFLAGSAVETDPSMFGRSYDLSFTVTLSDAYTSAGVNADCDSLLNYWSFDEVREWNTGPVDFTSCPYICYNEPDGVVDPQNTMFLATSSIYTDPNSFRFDGSIMGLPLPLTVTVPGSGSQQASYDAYFNPKHHNYTVDDCPGPTFRGGTPSTGSYATAERATESWPDFVTLADACGDIAPCPSLLTAAGFREYGMNHQAGKLTVAKYAEIFLANRPAVNWDRPFAGGSVHDDENTRDEPTQDCTADGSEGDLTYGVSGSFWTINCNTGSEFVKPCGDPVWTDLTTKSVDDYYNDETRKYDFVVIHYDYNFRDRPEDTRYNDALHACDEEHATGTSIRPGTGALTAVTAGQSYFEYDSCKANIIVIQPSSNSASFSRYNARVFSLAAVDCDDQYGSLIQRRPVQIMTDPFWRRSLKPCGIGSIPEDSDCTDINWHEADGQVWPIDDIGGVFFFTDGNLCPEDQAFETDSGCNNYTMYYPMRPWVEARTGPPSDSCSGSHAATLDSKARKLGCDDYIALRNSAYLTGSGFQNPDLLCEYCDPPSAYVITELDGSVNFKTPLTRAVLPWVISSLQCDCVSGGGRFASIYAKNIDGCGVSFLDF